MGVLVGTAQIKCKLNIIIIISTGNCRGTRSAYQGQHRVSSGNDESFKSRMC